MNDKLLRMLESLPQEERHLVEEMYNSITSIISEENCSDCDNDGLGGSNIAQIVIRDDVSFTEDMEC